MCIPGTYNQTSGRITWLSVGQPFICPFEHYAPTSRKKKSSTWRLLENGVVLLLLVFICLLLLLLFSLFSTTATYSRKVSGDFKRDFTVLSRQNQVRFSCEATSKSVQFTTDPTYLGATNYSTQYKTYKQ